LPRLSLRERQRLPIASPQGLSALNDGEKASVTKRHKASPNVTRTKRHQTSQTVTNRHSVTLPLFRLYILRLRIVRSRTAIDRHAVRASNPTGRQALRSESSLLGKVYRVPKQIGRPLASAITGRAGRGLAGLNSTGLPLGRTGFGPRLRSSGEHRERRTASLSAICSTRISAAKSWTLGTPIPKQKPGRACREIPRVAGPCRLAGLQAISRWRGLNPYQYRVSDQPSITKGHHSGTSETAATLRSEQDPRSTGD
jgi:hypothetical protein